MNTTPSVTGNEKYRSIDPAYVPLIIREYTHWTLLVHENQNYLGRTVLWFVHEGKMQRFSDLKMSELVELRMLTKQIEQALYELWRPDHMNYAWLGNLFSEHQGHGHMHLIPRYASPRIFRRHEYTDSTWGTGDKAPAYKPDQEELFAIRDAIKEALDD